MAKFLGNVLGYSGDFVISTIPKSEFVRVKGLGRFPATRIRALPEEKQPKMATGSSSAEIRYGTYNGTEIEIVRIGRHNTRVRYIASSESFLIANSEYFR